MSDSSYKTNKRPKNRSIEERLERLADYICTDFIELDDNGEHPWFRGMETAKNQHVIYERIGNYIDALERFRSKLNLPNEVEDDTYFGELDYDR